MSEQDEETQTSSVPPAPPVVQPSGLSADDVQAMIAAAVAAAQPAPAPPVPEAGHVTLSLSDLRALIAQESAKAVKAQAEAAAAAGASMVTPTKLAAPAAHTPVPHDEYDETAHADLTTMLHELVEGLNAQLNHVSATARRETGIFLHGALDLLEHSGYLGKAEAVAPEVEKLLATSI